MTYTAPRSKHTSVDHGRISISLPPLPFEIPKSEVDETKPVSLPVRGELTPQEKRWLRFMGRVKV